MILAPFSRLARGHRHHVHHRPLVQRHHRRRAARFRRSSNSHDFLRWRRSPCWSAMSASSTCRSEQRARVRREYAKAQALRRAKSTAQPRPVSPFNWTVFVSDESAHRFAHVNLVRKEARPYQPGDGFIARIDSPYLPLDQAVWVTRTRYGEADQDADRARRGTRRAARASSAGSPTCRRSTASSERLRLVHRPALPHAGPRGHAVSLSAPAATRARLAACGAPSATS